MKTGVELIIEERERQISEEGWNAAHDDGHVDAELARVASCYAIYTTRGTKCGTGLGVIDHMWPAGWDSKWWKPSDDPIRNLVKAGAVIAAEIDRIKRAALKKASE